MHFKLYRLETTWSRKPDHLDSIGSSGVGWVLSREMARFCFSSARFMSRLSPIHWPEKTHCGHVFHMRCLLQHLNVIPVPTAGHPTN
ncbi:hypothetical protein TNCV_3836261 [Trichonephila clavipes]|nr:hypothetical protein TNCV_3836261 [Trichonephila clavipes]